MTGKNANSMRRHRVDSFAAVSQVCTFQAQSGCPINVELIHQKNLRFKQNWIWARLPHCLALPSVHGPQSPQRLSGLSVIPEVFPGSDHLGYGYMGCLPGQVCAFVRFLASALTPHLVPGSATNTSSLSRLRASWVLPLHNSEVERSLRGSPREEPWSDLLGQRRVGWGAPGCTPPPPSMG